MVIVRYIISSRDFVCNRRSLGADTAQQSPEMSFINPKPKREHNSCRRELSDCPVEAIGNDGSRPGDTYLGVATDHVIESFRNRLWAGYKTPAPASSPHCSRSSIHSRRRSGPWALSYGR